MGCMASRGLVRIILICRLAAWSFPGAISTEPWWGFDVIDLLAKLGRLHYRYILHRYRVVIPPDVLSQQAEDLLCCLGWYAAAGSRISETLALFLADYLLHQGEWIETAIEQDKSYKLPTPLCVVSVYRQAQNASRSTQTP